MGVIDKAPTKDEVGFALFGILLLIVGLTINSYNNATSKEDHANKSNMNREHRYELASNYLGLHENEVSLEMNLFSKGYTLETVRGENYKVVFNEDYSSIESIVKTN